MCINTYYVAVNILSIFHVYKPMLMLTFFFFSETLCGPHEKRLLNDLLDPYNTLERPVANESEPLQLSFGLMLMQIIDVVSDDVLHYFFTAENNISSQKHVS